MATIKTLSDIELLSVIKNLVRNERKLNIEILHHLAEVDLRKLYLATGYSSLFEYAVKELSYSESAAYRRISAMRLLKDIPEVEEKIVTGSINLSVAAQVQTFFKAEKKQNISYDKNKKLDLLSSVEYKSTRVVEQKLASINPELRVLEKVRAISENESELKLVIDDELKNKLQELKLFLSHVNSNMTYRDLISYLADLGLKKFSTRKFLPESKINSGSDSRSDLSSSSGFASTAAATSTTADAATSTAKLQPSCISQLQAPPAPEVNKVATRYISAAVRNKIWQRDNGCCTYIDPITKRKCNSRYQIQIDHIMPFALGGNNSEANLRLLCAGHNRYRNFSTNAPN